MKQIVLIVHNVRSCHNVGSLLRTADGLGVKEVFLTGYTPYPLAQGDQRLPHVSAKITRQIHKTSLGTEEYIKWHHTENIDVVIKRLKTEGFVLAAVEQAATAVMLPHYKSPEKIALLVGREVEGVEAEVLQAMDVVLEIPMFGKKESFNVVQAAAMVLYHCCFAV